MPLPPPAIDFERHNAEVKEVWDAYHAGAPVRTPLILGLNIRYTMARPDANPTGIDMVRYFADPAAMLQRQLEHAHWVRHNLPIDQEMGLPDAWGVGVDFQNAYEAGWFGCHMDYRPDQVPDTTPLLAEEDSKRRLFDQGLPDPFKGRLLDRGWDYYAWFQQQVEAGYEYCGRPLKHVGMTGFGTDGPVTVACNLRGATEFFCDLLADPDYAQELLSYITEATIARILAYREHLGQPAKTAGYGFADDSIALLSTAQYRDLVMPHHQRLIAALSEGTAANSIHLCGDATHHFKFLRDTLDIQSFDTGFPVDHGRLRAELGPAVTIQGGPSVPFLCSHTPAQVKAEARRILESGIREGGKFILREGNNLPPECPVANVWAMVEAVHEFGRY